MPEWAPIYGTSADTIITAENANAEVFPDGPIGQQYGDLTSAGWFDNFNTNAPIAASFEIPVTGMYQVNVYLHPKNSVGFAGDTLQFGVSYVSDNNEHLLYEPSILNIMRSAGVPPSYGVAATSVPLYCSSGTTLSIYTYFQTYGATGTVPADTSNCSGVVSHGTFQSGETIFQGASYATRTATATFAGILSTNTLIAYGVSGVPDGSNWTGHTSGAVWTSSSTLTPNANPFYGPGETVVQTGTGASALLVNTPSGSSGMYVTNIVGTPNATGIWIGLSNSDAFVPSGAQPGLALDTFFYHLSFRLVFIPQTNVM